MLQIRERDSKSQQLRLDSLFKGQTAKAAAQEAAAAAAGDADVVEQGVSLMEDDMEDMLGVGAGHQTSAAAGQQQRGKARVMTEGDVQEQRGNTAAPMQVDQANNLPADVKSGNQRQQQYGKENQQQQPAPDRSANYKAWVAYQKQQWQSCRQQRKRQKTDAANRRVTADQAGPQVRCLVYCLPWTWLWSAASAALSLCTGHS